MSLLTGMSAKRRRISTAALRLSATLRMTIKRSTSLHSLAPPPCPRTEQHDTRRLELSDDAVDHGRCDCVGVHYLVSVLLSKKAFDGWERFSGNLATSSLGRTRLLSWRCYALRGGSLQRQAASRRLALVVGNRDRRLLGDPVSDRRPGDPGHEEAGVGVDHVSEHPSHHVFGLDTPKEREHGAMRVRIFADYKPA